jgi:hypothetical protein
MPSLSKIFTALPPLPIVTVPGPLMIDCRVVAMGFFLSDFFEQDY